MTKSWVKGIPAFLVVAVAVVGVGLLLDSAQVDLGGAGRMLYSLFGVVLAVAAGVWLARRRDENGSNPEN